MTIFFILVEDRDDFDHFLLDSPKYSPYQDDPRIIIGTKNVFSIVKAVKGCF